MELGQIVEDAKKIAAFNKREYARMKKIREAVEIWGKVVVDFEEDYFDVRFKDKKKTSYATFNYCGGDLDLEQSFANMQSEKIIVAAGKRIQRSYERYWDAFDKLMDELGWVSDDNDETTTDWTKERWVLRVPNCSDDWSLFDVKEPDTYEWKTIGDIYDEVG